MAAEGQASQLSRPGCQEHSGQQGGGAGTEQQVGGVVSRKGHRWMFPLRAGISQGGPSFGKTAQHTAGAESHAGACLKGVGGRRDRRGRLANRQLSKEQLESPLPQKGKAG